MFEQLVTEEPFVSLELPEHHNNITLNHIVDDMKQLKMEVEINESTLKNIQSHPAIF